MSEELIKLSDAIKAIQYSNLDTLNVEERVALIKTIPTIELKRGEWVDISEWYAPRQKCSICETVVDGYGSNFCPNCGADMREREGE